MQADYALRYKARVPRPLLAKHFSEYQKQFQWRDAMKTSPLLGAEEVTNCNGDKLLTCLFEVRCSGHVQLLSEDSL